MCQKAELKEIVYREMEGTAGSPKVRGFVLEKKTELWNKEKVFSLHLMGSGECLGVPGSLRSHMGMKTVDSSLDDLGNVLSN